MTDLGLLNARGIVLYCHLLPASADLHGQNARSGVELLHDLCSAPSPIQIGDGKIGVLRIQKKHLRIQFVPKIPVSCPESAA